MAAEGETTARMGPATERAKTEAIRTVLLQREPPSLEKKAAMPAGAKVKNGTMALPFGCPTGWPPTPSTRSALASGALQLRPPSLDRLICITVSGTVSHWV